VVENEANRKANNYMNQNGKRENWRIPMMVKQYLDEVLEELHRKPVHSQGY
jgi:hypothetical protein